MRKWIFGLIVVGASALLVWLFIETSWFCCGPDDKSDLIKIFTPKLGEVTVSPLVVTGEARGFWFFEASFPVKLVDEQGNLIVQGIAQAQDEWMTENFVPFKVTLEFSTFATSGFLVLEKDNPSGLPENADEIRAPIRF
ncbi:MAG: hypothetical protein A3I24_02100 [Candidatus Harrisonbacteria bacterium RIFCSPLOWO2_02_FULL_41_13b]|uniref:Bacterial spore germination immunoglobulin-like domain-containing protein n=1 Tax=Candidatus Harrisonbacteria bacterium RIFCSPLOWO2_02_FULL_41_13b TaxID=1798409 RepID=A0A1G1ZVS6_9BACT|nr:MAG: hypothetical protein A3J53_00955 [Candidatus Harrisonbacteria bacterium RIFCSPHIGHO2_02_FULL_40_20]OGY67937.1 MAG: hypothetical protein A3I24_02100 [Candidatus Harrisonbacteria bacterium RIFCSPLOWO2_02_FULL_41_13b]